MPRLRKNPPNAQRDSVTPDPDRPLDLLSLAPVAPESRDVVKVNNANLTELKNACDDAIKRYLARPELFNQIHLHTDVRLALGWSGVFVAAGTGLYGWRVEFEQSKPVVWTGLILYIVLTALQALYAYFVEGDIVFVGKRKTFSKRIITERITIASRTQPASTSSSLFSSKTLTQKSSPSSSPSFSAPLYTLTLTYICSSSAGRSLLARGRTHTASPYTAFFDSEGVMDQDAFERWVGERVGECTNGGT